MKFRMLWEFLQKLFGDPAGCNIKSLGFPACIQGKFP